MNIQEYPECEKLDKASSERDSIVSFLDWLGENNVRLYLNEAYEGYDNSVPMLCRESPDSLAMRFLDIDQITLEKERSELLKQLPQRKESK